MATRTPLSLNVDTAEHAAAVANVWLSFLGELGEYGLVKSEDPRQGEAVREANSENMEGSRRFYVQGLSGPSATIHGYFKRGDDGFQLDLLGPLRADENLPNSTPIEDIYHTMRTMEGVTEPRSETVYVGTGRDDPVLEPLYRFGELKNGGMFVAVGKGPDVKIIQYDEKGRLTDVRIGPLDGISQVDTDKMVMSEAYSVTDGVEGTAFEFYESQRPETEFTFKASIESKVRYADRISDKLRRERFQCGDHELADNEMPIEAMKENDAIMGVIAAMDTRPVVGNTILSGDNFALVDLEYRI